LRGRTTYSTLSANISAPTGRCDAPPRAPAPPRPRREARLAVRPPELARARLVHHEQQRDLALLRERLDEGTAHAGGTFQSMARSRRLAGTHALGELDALPAEDRAGIAREQGVDQGAIAQLDPLTCRKHFGVTARRRACSGGRPARRAVLAVIPHGTSHGLQDLGDDPIRVHVLGFRFEREAARDGAARPAHRLDVPPGTRTRGAQVRVARAPPERGDGGARVLAPNAISGFSSATPAPAARAWPAPRPRCNPPPLVMNSLGHCAARRHQVTPRRPFCTSIGRPVAMARTISFSASRWGNRRALSA